MVGRPVEAVSRDLRLWLWFVVVFVVCGLWFVVCGLWFVVCGLWFVNRSQIRLSHVNQP